MSSVFDQLFGDGGVAALMDGLGTTAIVYLEPEGNPVTLTAIVGHMEVAKEAESSPGRRKEARRSVTICLDEDGPYGGVAEPHLSAEIQIDGEWWAVEGIEAQTATMARLAVVRKTVTELSRTGYRAR